MTPAMKLAGLKELIVRDDEVDVYLVGYRPKHIATYILEIRAAEREANGEEE